MKNISVKQELIRAAKATMLWARTPCDHGGGNPYCLPMVKAARRALIAATGKDPYDQPLEWFSPEKEGWTMQRTLVLSDGNKLKVAARKAFSRGNFRGWNWTAQEVGHPLRLRVVGFYEKLEGFGALLMAADRWQKSDPEGRRVVDPSASSTPVL